MAVGSDENLVESVGEPAETPFEGEPAEAFAEAPETIEAWEDEEPAERIGGFAWVVPTLAVLAVLGWTTFFGWVHRDAILAGASPAQWADWTVDWAVPVLLIVALWLIAMRYSRREAARFAPGVGVRALMPASKPGGWTLNLWSPKRSAIRPAPYRSSCIPSTRV